MKIALKYLSIAWKLGAKYKIYILFSIALIFLVLSYFIVPGTSNLNKSVDKLQNTVQERQALLEEYVQQVIDTPLDEWISFEDFPSDMVIYRYNADTLQTWVNQFPISNDDVDGDAPSGRIEQPVNRMVYTPLLVSLNEGEQYVNLGSAWYIVKVYKFRQTKIISGILIKTDYFSNNLILKNRVNPYFELSGRMSIVPISFNGGYVVNGIGGEPLFSVVDDVTKVNLKNANSFLWMALVFICWGLYVLLIRKKNKWVFFIYVLGLSAIRYVCFVFVGELRFDTLLFSPSLYADEGVFSSMGNLLLNNLYVFLVALGIFVVRKKLIRYIQHSNEIINYSLVLVFVSLPIGLMIYINFIFNSVIYNSNIALELYRLADLNIYSVLVYFSYGLLFMALLLLLQIVFVGFRLLKKRTLFTTRNILIYVVLVSLYTLITISYKGFYKENDRAKVWANKLSVERDISLELQLLSIEKRLALDTIVRRLIPMQDYYAENKLKSRLEDEYLVGVNQKYDIRITICKPNDKIMQKETIVDCTEAYNQKLRYAIALSEKSNFYYVNSYNGKVNYLGIFDYVNRDRGRITLYIELESMYLKDVIGYSSFLLDNEFSVNVNLPREYSYAKYLDGKLVQYRGNYDYPMAIDTSFYKAKSFNVSKDKYLHFVNAIGNDNLLFISRPKRSVYPYIVFFSYLMLFYSGLFFSFLRLRKLGKTKIKLKLPKNSLRRKITYLLITSLVVSLLCMGLGSVWFCINYYNDTNKVKMEEKLNIVHTTLTDLCKYAYDYTYINTSTFFQTIDKMASNNQIDINIFDPHGRLIRSSKSELFDKFLLSSRINPKAYEQIIYKKKKQVINKEHLSELSYTSLYAPIFNTHGKLVAIVNIPYFFKDNIITNDVSTILATIINIYILLILASILGGTMVSNQISKPLAELSRKMQYISVSTKAEHIDYKNNDELGVLVNAYNKMVDDLEESTIRLAQTEREKAWSEMARQIAHEIKNPLTPMRLSIQHLIRLKQNNVEGWENKFEDVAGSILEQIDILSNTASEFSSFAKFYYEENSIINLYQILSEQKTLFDTRDNIRIAFYHCSEECNIYARKGQIIRVIVNLLSNAIQAVEDNGRGYIKISLNQDKQMYSVSFEDNGYGVKEEDESKLFKPNFTTKSSGTGLGLAISKNIIEQSGGKIFYKKSEFGGACFTFTLPKHISNFIN